MTVKNRIAQHSSTEPRFEPFGAARRDGFVILTPSKYLKRKAPQLYKWLVKLFRNDNGIDSKILLRDQSDDDTKRFTLSIWSEENEYVISANLPSGRMVTTSLRHRGGCSGKIRHKTKLTKDKGYLGCGCVNRAPYAGEQHRRAGDMYDGDFSEKTWNGIIQDIFTSMVVELHSWARKSNRDDAMFETRLQARKRRTTKAKAK